MVLAIELQSCLPFTHDISSVNFAKFRPIRNEREAYDTYEITNMRNLSNESGL